MASRTLVAHYIARWSRTARSTSSSQVVERKSTNSGFKKWRTWALLSEFTPWMYPSVALYRLYVIPSRTLPPVAGVCNGALVLKDQLFVKMEPEALSDVFAPKVDGPTHLSDIFSEPTLDFFVLFSSMSSVVGNAGQSNYNAVSLFQVAIARQRREKGLAASVMALGMVADAGYIAAKGPTLMERLKKAFYMPISESDLIRSLLKLLLLASLELDILGSTTHVSPTSSHEEEGSKDVDAGRTGQSNIRILERLDAAGSEEEAVAALLVAFRAKVEIRLQMTPDSLKVEVRSWFLKEVHIDVPVLKALSGDNARDICADAANKYLSAKMQENKSDTGDASKLWFLSQFSKDDTSYNCVYVYQVTGNIHIPRLKRAVSTVANHHDSLRTCFFTRSRSGEPVQGLLASARDCFKHIKDENGHALEQEMRTWRNHVWQLSDGDVLRVILATHRPEEHSLIIAYHHIAMDGVSMHLFLNMLPLRFNVQKDTKFSDLVTKTAQHYRTAQPNMGVPFHVILDKTNVPRESTSTPLFQVAMNYRQGNFSKIPLGGSNLEFKDGFDAQSPYDLAFSVTPNSDTTYVQVVAREDLYTKEGTDTLLSAYLALLHDASRDVSKTLENINLYDQSDIDKALSLGYGNVVDYEWPSTLTEKVDEAIERTHHNVAVRDAYSQLTYGELAVRVNSLASTIQSQLRPGSPVAILYEPTTYWLISILAIIRSGCIYVPLDGKTLQHPPSLTDCYGPTEISCCATMKTIDLFDNENNSVYSSVGPANPNTSIYILGESVNVVPQGLTGEIGVGGVGVALSYRDERSTSQKFVPNPFATAGYTKKWWTMMYRTRDKGLIRADGGLQFMGRMDCDTTVKLRALRVDLDDVANVMLQQFKDSLEDVVVTVRGDPAFLVAHVVLTLGASMDASKLQELASTPPLPQSMRPALTDRRAIAGLPLPTTPASYEPLKKVSDRKPTLAEGELRLIWHNVLSRAGLVNNTRLEPDTDFFHVGGNSLLLVRLRSAIKISMGITLPLSDMYRFSTLAGMADMEVETALPQSIDLSHTHDATPVKTETGLEILMTRSTSFLGKEILRSLLSRPSLARIHCIAVDPDSETNHLKDDRITVYPGSLSEPMLGLKRETYQHLQATVDTIILAGSHGHCLNNYSTLRATNVESTRQMGLFALGRRIPIYYISSNRVTLLNTSEKAALPPVSVKYYEPPTDGSEEFTAAKWAGEVFLEKLSEAAIADAGRDLPVSIHRHCAIVGDETPIEDALNALIRYPKLINAVPRVSTLNVGGYFDFLPVTDVAKSFVEFVVSSQGTHSGVAFQHYSSGVKVPPTDFASYMQKTYGDKFRELELYDCI
ncbi:polyketide synthase [Fusarium mundagurra]|uniref:Polyketide synthase n=1 Tax=Fusarium mundagurra TaxID=1567541 RepID=A0A8H5YEX1_9HYPO|nr:polyketide synthase [Fusarium mundagurra]